MAENTRCLSQDGDGNHCRKPAWHVHEDTPHRWWASTGTGRSEWPATAMDRLHAALKPKKVPKPATVATRYNALGQEQRISTPATRALKDSLTPLAMHVTGKLTKPKRIADFTVRNCFECPMFEAVLERCHHPAMGAYGHEVTMQEMCSVPDFCPLRLTQLTIEVKAA